MKRRVTRRFTHHTIGSCSLMPDRSDSEARSVSVLNVVPLQAAPRSAERCENIERV
jgi:hypothetical protein